MCNLGYLYICRVGTCGILPQTLLVPAFPTALQNMAPGAQGELRALGAQVLAWLRCKLRRLRAALAQHSAAHAAMDEASLTAYSVRLLGEYLPEPWLQRLCDTCHVSAVPGVAFVHSLASLSCHHCTRHCHQGGCACTHGWGFLGGAGVSILPNGAMRSLG